jgi:hypothetical protein
MKKTILTIALLVSSAANAYYWNDIDFSAVTNSTAAQNYIDFDESTQNYIDFDEELYEASDTNYMEMYTGTIYEP